jgi:hypothetical protein
MIAFCSGLRQDDVNQAHMGEESCFTKLTCKRFNLERRVILTIFCL